MTPNDLMPFCHDHGKMEFPWSCGDHTYASNGFLILRVPRIEEVEREDGPSVATIYRDNPLPEDGWVDLPTIEALGEPIKCPKCQGEASDEDCPECDGDGVVTYWSGYHEYEWDCRSCDGEGVKGLKCDECKNTGTIDPNPTVEIAGHKYSSPYIRLFAAFPNAKLAMSQGKVAWIKFDGGDGLVMPRTCGDC